MFSGTLVTDGINAYQSIPILTVSPMLYNLKVEIKTHFFYWHAIAQLLEPTRFGHVNIREGASEICKTYFLHPIKFFIS